jgi:hypothetical protein
MPATLTHVHQAHSHHACNVHARLLCNVHTCHAHLGRSPRASGRTSRGGRGVTEVTPLPHGMIVALRLSLNAPTAVHPLARMPFNRLRQSGQCSSTLQAYGVSRQKPLHIQVPATPGMGPSDCVSSLYRPHVSTLHFPQHHSTHLTSFCVYRRSAGGHSWVVRGHQLRLLGTDLELAADLPFNSTSPVSLLSPLARSIAVLHPILNLAGNGGVRNRSRHRTRPLRHPGTPCNQFLLSHAFLVLRSLVRCAGERGAAGGVRHARLPHPRGIYVRVCVRKDIHNKKTAGR